MLYLLVRLYYYHYYYDYYYYLLLLHYYYIITIIITKSYIIILSFILFDPEGLPYKFLVFAPEADRWSSRDFEWSDL